MANKLRLMRAFAYTLIFSTVLTGYQQVTQAEENMQKVQQDKEQQKKQETKDVTYENKIFDQSFVHNINIEISEEDWTDLLANPLNKTKYQVDVTIDGEKIEDVSFATKGNTSLSSVAQDEDSDRYSFKLNFGKFVKGQTYYGLDKLNLNNIYADATYMKDYMAYEIFKAAGAEAPLTSYVAISINGKSFGLYLAVEEIGESYVERVHGGEGELYKPETEQLGNAGKQPGEMPKGMEPPQMPNGEDKPEGIEPPQMPNENRVVQGQNGMNRPGGYGGFGESTKGASLVYTDDALDSYSDIFDNAETDVTDEDKARVVEALKGLSQGKDIEKYIDTESVIRYFVAHNFVLNGDSYTGNMLHNYYLYENEGRLSMLPWDYNLAFGAFMQQKGMPQDQEVNGKDKANKTDNSNSTSIINSAIDTPLSTRNEAERPMWSWIANNESYLSLYHTYYDELMTNYFKSGKFEAEIDRVYEMILPYVEEDASAFYDVAAFKKGYETLKAFCTLRAESIEKQLKGEIASETEKQDSTTFVQADHIKISDMGTHDMGMGNKGMKKTDLQNEQK